MRIIWYIVVFSFIFEILSLSTGMGFGTKLVPILFMLGYHTFQVIPPILSVQVITGLVAGVFHHEFKNVHLSFSPLNTASKVLLLLTISGCFSITFSIFFVHVLIQPSTFIIQLFVAWLVIVGGSISLWKNRKEPSNSPSTSNTANTLTQLAGFGFLAAFIKGIGGSGYGPILTIGQITSGVYEKSAIGIMPITESGVATVGILSLYLFPRTIDMFLLPSIFTGSYFAAIFSPYLVRCIPNKLWSYIVPGSAFIIGTITLLKTVLF